MKKNHSEKIEQAAKNILNKMGVEHKIIIEEEPETIYLNIESPDSALLIGWHGETLNSLEHLLKVIIQKEIGFEKQFPKLMLDISGYRKEQLDKLKDFVHTTAQKVIKYKRPEVLRPMNAYERRMVHVILKEIEEIVTESVGEEPNRRIMIRLK